MSNKTGFDFETAGMDSFASISTKVTENAKQFTHALIAELSPEFDIAAMHAKIPHIPVDTVVLAHAMQINGMPSLKTTDIKL